ncbi:MAG: hypothetical protein C4583_19105 [Anaerolineaceae bacterium]|nr:MAG: hypothetical protein C4583_19105 [Anaerolineaceae bacterium]
MKPTLLSSPLISFLVILLLTSSCQPAGTLPHVPTPCPTPAASPYPTAVPTQSATRTPRPSPLPDYTRKFLETLPASPNSCHPDHTADDIGVYIYDLKAERELVSINADVPFQFASAFKAPVLVYFLSSCHQYWDASSPEWKEYFQDAEAAKNVEQFTSPEYERKVAEFISDPKNWKDVGKFFAEHRQIVNGAGGEIDTRYFILEKVYGMIAQSQNIATAEVLLFIQENCPKQAQIQVESQCGDANAITNFNAWFNDFSGITYENGTPHRGLFRWDTVIQNTANGSEEITLPTFGLKDLCVTQTAILNCDPAFIASNTLTARDFFRFYYSLYIMSDVRLRSTAFNLLAVDEPGPARGYLKNLTRSLPALSFSKNGHAFFINGSINTDAGIVRYKGKDYIVVTLSFNALSPMTMLYGSYDSDGNPVGDPGLIQMLLEEYSSTP